MSRAEAYQAMVDAVANKDASALNSARKAFQATISRPFSHSVEGRSFLGDSIGLASPKGWRHSASDIQAAWNNIAKLLKSDWIQNIA